MELKFDAKVIDSCKPEAESFYFSLVRTLPTSQHRARSEVSGVRRE